MEDDFDGHELSLCILKVTHLMPATNESEQVQFQAGLFLQISFGGQIAQSRLARCARYENAGTDDKHDESAAFWDETFQFYVPETDDMASNGQNSIHIHLFETPQTSCQFAGDAKPRVVGGASLSVEMAFSSPCADLWLLNGHGKRAGKLTALCRRGRNASSVSEMELLVARLHEGHGRKFRAKEKSLQQECEQTAALRAKLAIVSPSPSSKHIERLVERETQLVDGLAEATHRGEELSAALRQANERTMELEKANAELKQEVRQCRSQVVQTVDTAGAAEAEAHVREGIWALQIKSAHRSGQQQLLRHIMSSWKQVVTSQRMSAVHQRMQSENTR
jgi:hypothetical protein